MYIKPLSHIYPDHQRANEGSLSPPWKHYQSYRVSWQKHIYHL